MLDTAVGVALPSVHPNVLLAPRVDPCSRPGVVVDEIRSALGRPSLLPSWRKLSCPRAGSPRIMHHRASCCCCGGRWGGCLLGRQRRRVRTGAVLGQRSVLMSLALDLRGRLRNTGFSSPRRTGWPIPACCPSIVVDIIGSAQIVLPAFPTSGQSALRVLKRTESATALPIGSPIQARRGSRATGWGRHHARRAVRNRQLPPYAECTVRLCRHRRRRSVSWAVAIRNSRTLGGEERRPTRRWADLLRRLRCGTDGRREVS